MAEPFDVTLPAVGTKPWTLNPAVQEIRQRIASADDKIATVEITGNNTADTVNNGRLSDVSLTTQINNQANAVSKVVTNDLAPGAVFRSQAKLPLIEKATVGYVSNSLFSLGARTSTRALLSAPGSNYDAMKSGFVEVNPTFTNLLVNSQFSGGTPGTLASSGGTATMPTNWANFNTEIAKDLISVGSGEISYRSKGFSNVNHGEYGGIRSLNYFNPGAPVLVEFEVKFNELPADKEMTVVVGWHNVSSGGVENRVGADWGKYVVTSQDTTDYRRAFALLPAPSGDRSLVFVTTAGEYQGDVSTLQPVTSIRAVSIYRVSEAGLNTTTQPWHIPTGTTLGKDIAIKLPAGNYAFVGRLFTGEVISRSVVVPAGSTSVSLRSVVGGAARLTVFAFVPIKDYDPRDAEQLSDYYWESAILGLTEGNRMSFNSHAISRGINKPATGFARAAEGANPGYSVMYDRWHEMTHRYEVRPGDRALGDSATQVRAESTYWEEYPYSSAFVTAGWLTCDRLDYQTPLAPVIVRQLRYVMDPDPSINPELTVNVYPRPTPGKWGLQFRTVLSGNVEPNQVVAYPEAPAQNMWDYDIGQLVYVVTRIKFDRTGNGRFEAWVNPTGRPFSADDPGSGAVKLFDGTGSFGYNGVSSFRIRFGLYHFTWDTPRIIRQHKLVFGTSSEFDAESLANFPPPRVVS